MPSLASYTESRSSQERSRKQWLSLLVLTALATLFVASSVGLSLSAVAFSRPLELRTPGHGIAHSFAMFASILSLLYILLHILAARKGARLYFEPPLPSPSFRHQLHAWAIIVVRIAAAMWASATVAVAVSIHRGGGNTVHLNATMFTCATGLLATGTLLLTLQLAHRPFPPFPWLSRAAASDEEPYDSKTGRTATPPASCAADEDTDTDRTLGGGSPSPVAVRANKASGTGAGDGGGGGPRGGGKTRRSTSVSERARERKMARTRRYVLEALTPSGLSPVKPQRSREGEGQARFEERLVPGVLGAESFFSAASTLGLAKGKGGAGAGGPGTPERVVYGGLPSVPARTGGGLGGDGHRRLPSSPLGPRGMSKAVGVLVRDVGGGGAGGLGRMRDVGAGVRPAPVPAPAPAPPQPPPLVPVPAYTVPGAWMPHLHGDEGVVGYAG
ncbi:hypothetical protein BT67DRAFT_8294 [Trichocladium antarcticum]|uniref:Uncharacterized protein n=1 Tax=Trichocladium antarcticum TaxID=1450529 RepID=A0AAN6UT27_9PEZI|nr:hypothetical protein BT67DRAFT_8294 [Trichocladium antarcticum]